MSSMVNASARRSPHGNSVECWCRSEAANLAGELSHQFGKLAALSRRNPFQEQALRIVANKLEKSPDESKPLDGHIVALEIVTIPDVAPRHQNPVGPFAEPVHDVVGRNGARAHHPDDTNVGRILQATDPRQIGAGVAASIAQKRQDLRLELCCFHACTSSIIAHYASASSICVYSCSWLKPSRQMASDGQVAAQVPHPLQSA